MILIFSLTACVPPNRDSKAATDTSVADTSVADTSVGDTNVADTDAEDTGEAGPGPVAWWSFDDGTSPTLDEVTGLELNLHGTGWQEGGDLPGVDGNERALSFDGVTSYGQAGDADPDLDGFTALTLSAWVRREGALDPAVVTPAALVSKYDSVSDWPSYALMIVDGGEMDGQVQLYVATDADHQLGCQTSDALAPIGEWVHVVGKIGRAHV
jgi:hypothetical protein